MTRTGSDADCGIKTCTALKAMAARPNATNSTMSLQLLQAYSEPPHCNAKTRQTMQGTKKNVPKGSRRMTCCLIVADGVLGFAGD